MSFIGKIVGDVAHDVEHAVGDVFKGATDVAKGVGKLTMALSPATGMKRSPPSRTSARVAGMRSRAPRSSRTTRRPRASR